MDEYIQYIVMLCFDVIPSLFMYMYTFLCMAHNLRAV